jgi:hypothetical protein
MSRTLSFSFIFLLLGDRCPPDPPRFPSNLGEYVRIAEGAKLYGESELVVPKTALFEALRWSDYHFNPGQTVAEQDSMMSRDVWVRTPYSTYRVSRKDVTWTNDPPRDIPDNEKAALFQKIEETLGAAETRASCVTRDVLADVALSAARPDSVALAILDSVSVDPAAFPEIKSVGSRTYTRPPDWGARRHDC